VPKGTGGQDRARRGPRPEKSEKKRRKGNPYIPGIAGLGQRGGAWGNEGIRNKHPLSGGDLKRYVRGIREKCPGVWGGRKKMPFEKRLEANEGKGKEKKKKDSTRPSRGKTNYLEKKRGLEKKKE